MPQRPSNREIKALTHLGEENALGPGDFKDIGEKVFTGMLKKGWVVEVEGLPGDHQGADDPRRRDYLCRTVETISFYLRSSRKRGPLLVYVREINGGSRFRGNDLVGGVASAIGNIAPE